MKKFIVFLAFFSSLHLFSQSEMRKEYNYVIIIEKGKQGEPHEGRNTLIFNYQNEHRLKMIRSDGEVNYYTQIGNFKKDTFKDVHSNVSYNYQYAKFLNDTTDFIFTIKVFDDPTLGCVMQVDETLSLQYLP